MGERTKSEDALIKDGWTRRFVAMEPRLSEAVELYRSMGHEVHLEPLGPSEESEDCRVCFKGFEDQYKIIFTRPKRGENDVDDL